MELCNVPLQEICTQQVLTGIYTSTPTLQRFFCANLPRTKGITGCNMANDAIILRFKAETESGLEYPPYGLGGEGRAVFYSNSHKLPKYLFSVFLHLSYLLITK